MLSLLLLFAAISAVYPYTCNQFTFFVHQSSIMPYLNGEFFKIASSADVVFDCEKVTWTGTGSSLVAISQSSNCCRKFYDPIFSADGIEFDVMPLNMNAGCPLGTDNTKVKLISVTGSGEDECYVQTACRASRQGIYVFCRQSIIEKSLLDEIIDLVAGLVEGLLGVPSLKSVNQSNCTYPANNCGQ